ncbi:MAG: SulP family inorganic anion transporter [Bryobacteraceae bacterium]
MASNVIVSPESKRESSPPQSATRSSVGSDLVASLVVFLVALPLCMGIAIASGVPPALGILTGIIGGIVVGSLSGSPLQVSGPAAGLSVVVFETVHKFGIEMLAPILLLAGSLQLIGGWLKLGRWFRAISPAVIYGMLSGIGILIIAGQFHVMVDDKPRPSGVANLIAIPESVWKGLFPPNGTVHHLAALIGVLTLASILLWNQFKPGKLKVIPGSLVGVVVGTVVAHFMHLPIKRVALPANLFESFRVPGASSIANMADPAIILAAVTIAVVASAETLLSASAVDRMHNGPRTNYDRELSAQGIGNALCGLFGALPMTGVIVRSSANVNAGAKTRLSAVMHGIWLLALVWFFPGVLMLIPTASLAAILVFTGFKLVEIHRIKRLAEYGKFPVVIYAVTVIGIVGRDLLTGVMIGLSLTLVKLLYKATMLKVEVVHSQDGRRVDVTLQGMATFLRLPKLHEVFDRLPQDSVIHLHVEHVHYIDHTCFDMLQNAAAQRAEQGGAVVAPWDQLATRFHLRQLQAV